MNYGNGDAQWMKAGRGVIHEEMWNIPKNRFEKIEIFQLWINSPVREKLSSPNVNVLRDEKIPRITMKEKMNESSPPFCIARVLCGDVFCDEGGQYAGPGNAVADSPICILHLSLKPEYEAEITFPADSTCCAYVQAGGLYIDEVLASNDGNHFQTFTMKEIRMGNIIVYKTNLDDEGHQKNGEGVTKWSISGANNIEAIRSRATIRAGKDGLECLLMIGQPLREPVVTLARFSSFLI